MAFAHMQMEAGGGYLWLQSCIRYNSTVSEVKELIQEAREDDRTADVKIKYRRHIDTNGGYDQNEIERNKRLNYFTKNYPIFLAVCNTNLP